MIPARQYFVEIERFFLDPYFPNVTEKIKIQRSASQNEWERY